MINIKYPLNLEEINDLINYENLFKKNLNSYCLEKIIEKYIILIEFYDKINNPMKNYFKEKLDECTLEFAINNENIDINNDNNLEDNKITNFDNRKTFRIKKLTFHLNKKKFNTLKLDKSENYILNKKQMDFDKIKIISKNINLQNNKFQLRLKNRKEKSLANSLKYIPKMNDSISLTDINNILGSELNENNSSYNNKWKIIEEEKKK